MNFSKLKRLKIDSLAHFVRILIQQIKQKFYSLIMKIYSKWWGVKLGKNCSFVGITIFKRAPQGIVNIGDQSRFLSLFSSNSIGINRNCMISALDYGAEVVIGNKVGMSGTVVSAKSSIKIGDRVMCGANTTITDSDAHSLDYRDRNHSDFLDVDENWTEPVETAPIVIEDDVFLGSNVIVLKGVTIGKGSVIGAGSVVTKSIPPFVIAAGQPAKIVSYLKDKYHDIDCDVDDEK